MCCVASKSLSRLEFIVKLLYFKELLNIRYFKELLNIEFWNCDPSKESDFFFFWIESLSRNNRRKFSRVDFCREN